MPKPNFLFHLEPKVPGLAKIHILGVQHGVAGIYHMAPADHAYFRTHIQAHPSVVLSEGLTDVLVVPPRYLPARLEPPWMKDVPAVTRITGKIAQSFGLVSMSWRPFGIRCLAENAGILFRRAASHLVLPLLARRRFELRRTPRSEGEDRRVFEDSARNSGIMVSDLELVDKTRSLFMAANALNCALGSEKEFTLVVGGAHASTIHRFLESPQNAIDYLQQLRERKKSDSQYLEGIDETRLDEVNAVFLKHPLLVNPLKKV